jgi:hypothetical protein
MKKFNQFREDSLLEVLKASDPTGKWIDDFVHSDNPKFAGKSKKERIQMALGAAYSAKRNEEVEDVAEGLTEMDNRTPNGDREEQRRNRPEAKAKQDKEQQNRLKDTSPEMRKKLRLPEPKQGVAEGHYAGADEHMSKANDADAKGDKLAYHHHMADYHDSLSQWHEDKGRSASADKHAEKADFHSDKYTELARGVKEAKDEGEYNYEGAMAKTQLQTICRNAAELKDMLEEDENLPEWVQAKITKAEDYITTSLDYMKSSEELGEEVEELDELSKSTLASYAKSASRSATIKRKIATDFEHRGNRAKSPGMKQASAKLSQDYKEKSWKRQNNVNKAIDRLAKEEVEPIEELNKDTVYSYNKKAEADQDKQFTKISKALKDNDPTTGNEAGHKFLKRSLGITRAEKRLNKEDTEVAEARMSAAQRLWNAEQKQRAKSDASLARTPSSIPKPEEKK